MLETIGFALLIAFFVWVFPIFVAVAGFVVILIVGMLAWAKESITSEE